LAKVFSSTTNSYKVLWFCAIVGLMRRFPSAKSVDIEQVLIEMLVVAWHPVRLYKLSLGARDQVARVLEEVNSELQLSNAESWDGVREAIANSPRARARVEELSRYVPTRFLTPWVRAEVAGLADQRKDGVIAEAALRSQGGSEPTPYWIEGRRIRFNDLWSTFFSDHADVLSAFAAHHLTAYLQARNPSVPGIPNKLSAPRARDLRAARRFWMDVGEYVKTDSALVTLVDIYSGAPLGPQFSIDHFIPWTFVAHDRHWNLVPVHPQTNSKKGDRLPALDTYLPRVASLHCMARPAMKRHPAVLDDFADTLKCTVEEFLHMDVASMNQLYDSTFRPLVDIARRQGFESEWRWPSQAN
jgi:predicted nucleic acid-binding protein